MSHLASTMRRVEHEEGAGVATAPDHSLPGVGSSVRFRLRGGEYRNGTNTFGAMVTREHPETGLLDLLVIMGADDFMEQRNVPRAMDGDFGWEPVESEADKVRAELAAFKEELAAVLFGPYPKSEESVYEVLNDLHQRIGALEGARASAPKAKRQAKPKG